MNAYMTYYIRRVPCNPQSTPLCICIPVNRPDWQENIFV